MPAEPSTSTINAVIIPSLSSQSPTADDMHDPHAQLAIHLVVNRKGVAPTVCEAWQGKVATQGSLDGFVFTSLNMDFVPRYPVFADIIKTHEDGRWGLHEYSRWPQPYIEGMMHLACILRLPVPPHLSRVLFTSLQPSKDWVERKEVMVNGLGFIREDTRSELAHAAKFAIDRFHGMQIAQADVQRYSAFLVMLLRQVVDRMTYVPAHRRTAITIAAHIQRLCLELAGLKTYVEQVVVRVQKSEDWSSSHLPVLGGFIWDLTDAQTWCCVGLPVWLIQPLTKELVVWRVVEPEDLPYGMSHTPCDPPILYKAGSFVGVSNVTGNWLTGMLMSVSRDIAGSHLEGLNLIAVPQVPEGGRPPKRARGDNVKQLTMRAAVPEATSATKKMRRGCKTKSSQVAPQAPGPATSEVAPSPSAPDAMSSAWQHPSRNFQASPFAEPLPVWVTALVAVSPVKQTQNAALYFYPPPFLLDSLSSIQDVCPHPECARVDKKVPRYLHNLCRIREFCRTRLFDRTLDWRPLTIGDWRTALWGDYRTKTHPLMGPDGSDVHREKRWQDERNQISLLFHQVAHMDSYSTDAPIPFRGLAVDVDVIAAHPVIRATLLWEAHELNFRADLMVLDHLLVNMSNWREREKWEREMLISGVWGEPSSGVTILPSLDDAAQRYCWFVPPESGWDGCCIHLRAFVEVLSRWPGCPEMILQARRASQAPSDEDYLNIQQCAVEFYMQSFVHSFARLPIPPIPLPM